MAPGLENPSDEPGFAVTTDGGIVEFRENVFVWNDRPPMLEIFANTTEEGWTWFRLFIFPKGDEPSPTPGEYRCGRDEVTVLTMRTDGMFDTRWSGSGCTVLVSEANLESGSRFAGTFCARLVTENGTGSLTVTAGSFFGVVGGT